MQSGPLRHRITIQKPNRPPNPFATGASATSWIDVATMWAKVTPLTSKEVYQAGQLAMKVSHTVTIRYPGRDIQVSAGYRIKFGSRILELQTGLVNPDERNITLELMAYEIDPTR